MQRSAKAWPRARERCGLARGAGPAPPRRVQGAGRRVRTCEAVLDGAWTLTIVPAVARGTERARRAWVANTKIAPIWGGAKSGALRGKKECLH